MSNPVEEVSTNENNQTLVNEESFATLFENMSNQVKSANNTIKFLKANIKELSKLHRSELKKAGVKKSRKKNTSGINKPNPVPESIRNLLNLEENVLMARTEVTKRIYGYIKENNLQDEHDKRTIVPNDELKQLFSLEDGEEVSFYNIQSYIKKLY